MSQNLDIEYVRKLELLLKEANQKAEEGKRQAEEGKRQAEEERSRRIEQERLLKEEQSKRAEQEQQLQHYKERERMLRTHQKQSLSNVASSECLLSKFQKNRAGQIETFYDSNAAWTFDIIQCRQPRVIFEYLKQQLTSCHQYSAVKLFRYDEGIQANILKAFYRSDTLLPIFSHDNKQKLDLRFLNVSRPAAQQVLNNIQKDAITDTKYFVLLGLSGCGKTSSMFEIAREQFVIFMQCNVAQSVVSETQDQGFLNMLTDLTPHWTEPSAEFEKRCEHRVLVEYTSRLMLLLWFVLTMPRTESTCLDFLHLQMGDGAWLCKCWIDHLIHLPDHSLHTLCEYAFQVVHSSHKSIVFALDEVHVGYSKIFPDTFSTSLNHVKRGFSRVLLRVASTFSWYIVTAGTALRLQSIQYVNSDIGKPDSLEIVTCFPNIQDPWNVLCTWLNLDGLKKCQFPQVEYLKGRPRLVSRVIEYLGQADHSSFESKHALLSNMIQASYNAHRSKLLSRLQDCMRHQTLREMLVSIYISSQMSSNKYVRWSFCMSDHVDAATSENTDLVEAGLLGLSIQQQDNRMSWKLDEPLSVDVLEQVVRFLHTDNHDTFAIRELHHLHALMQQFGSSFQGKGQIWEHIVLSAMTSSRFQGQPVSNLIETMFGKENATMLPEWTRRITYQAEGIVTSEELHMQDDVDSCTLSNIWIRPRSSMRPDALLFLDGPGSSQHCDRFVISVGMTMRYQQVDNAKIADQDLSTDLRYFYCKKNSTQQNKRANWLHEKWNVALHSQLRVAGILRLSIAMPYHRSIFPIQLVDNNQVLVGVSIQHVLNLFEEDRRVHISAILKHMCGI